MEPGRSLRSSSRRRIAGKWFPSISTSGSVFSGIGGYAYAAVLVSVTFRTPAQSEAGSGLVQQFQPRFDIGADTGGQFVFALRAPHNRNSPFSGSLHGFRA